MTRFGYYSPAWIGALVAGVLLHSMMQKDLAISTAAYWTWLASGVGLAAIVCQLGMLGAQGLFAQVLPAPGGKSIRGGVAVLAGAFVLAGIGLGVVSAFLGFENWEGAAIAARIFAFTAGGSLIAAAVAYFWGWPLAVTDFGGRE